MVNEYYEELKNNSKDQFDRYRTCKVLKDRDTGETLLSTRNIFDIPISPTDIYHTVESNEISRLDIISQKYYKNPLLWWVIAQANNIYDPFTSMSVGDILRIPAIETLYGYDGILL